MICGKTAYPTAKRAHEAARRIARIGRELRTYRCFDCGHYHLTSKLKGYDKVDRLRAVAIKQHRFRLPKRYQRPRTTRVQPPSEVPDDVGVGHEEGP